MRAVAISHSNMSYQIVQYYFDKAKIQEKPEQILKDSVLMSAVMDGMSPGLLASYPEFVRNPTNQDEHVRNYKIIANILQEHGADTNGFILSLDNAVKCMIVALLLSYETTFRSTGLQGLADFVSDILSNYNIEFDGTFSNDITNRVLYYAYAYLCDSPHDVEGFKRGLIKDGIPVLFSQEIEDEERNIYQIAYIYNLVLSYGRPTFRIRQITDKLLVQQKGERLETKVLGFQHKCADVNKVTLQSFQDCSKINSLVAKETISATIQQIILQSRDDQTSFLSQMEQLVEDDIDIKLLKEQGYKSKEKEFNIQIDHFIEQFSEMFGSSRDVMYHIFDVCAKIQSFDALQEVVVIIEQETNKKLNQSIQNLAKSQQNLKDQNTFIQNIHQLFIDHRNTLLHQQTSEFIQQVKQHLNKYNHQFDHTILEVPELNIERILGHIAAYMVNLAHNDSHDFLAEFISIQFDELSNVLNSQINIEEKQDLIQQVQQNIKYYEQILNLLKDEYQLNEKLNVIKELVNDPEICNSNETPIRLQYKKLAPECYTAITQLFQKTTQQVFANDNRVPIDDEEQQFTVSDYKYDLQNILALKQTSKLINFNYQELNQLLSKQTHFDYMIGGLNALKLQHYKKVDLSYAQQLLKQLFQLDEQIKKNNETQVDGQLSLAHFQTLYDLIDQINIVQERNKDSANSFMQNNSDFMEMLVRCIQAQIGDLTLLNDDFEKTKKERSLKVTQQLQMNTSYNLQTVFQSIHDVYNHFKLILQQLYNPNVSPTSTSAPDIQKRFAQLIQMLLCDVFQSGMKAKITLSLFGLVQKLLSQYNDLVCSVQSQINELQIVLSVVAELQRVYEAVKRPLLMLTNVTNGWILYKGALECPTLDNQKHKSRHTEMKDFIQFLTDLFNGNVILDDITQQLNSRSIMFLPYDRNQAQEFVSTRITQSAAGQKLLESALYCFNLLGEQLQGLFSEYVNTLIQGYKKEITDVIFSFQNVYEESLTQQTSIQETLMQNNQSQVKGTMSQVQENNRNRLMNMGDVLQRTRKPNESVSAETVDEVARTLREYLYGITAPLKALETLETDENILNSPLINVFKACYTSYLLQSLQNQANTLLQQSKQSGLDPRETSLGREVYDEIVENITKVGHIFDRWKEHSEHQLTIIDEQLQEINKIPYIFNVLASGRQQNIEQSQFKYFLPTVIKLQSINNQKARPSILLSQQMKSTLLETKSRSQNYKGRPGQQLLSVLQTLCREMQEIKVQIENSEASITEVNQFIIAAELLQYFQPYIEMISCYNCDQEVYNVILNFSKHYKGDLNVLKRQGNMLKAQMDQKLVRGLKQVLNQFDEFQKFKTICDKMVVKPENIDQTKELIRLQHIQAKVEARINVFMINTQETQAIINSVIDGPCQEGILMRYKEVIPDFTSENVQGIYKEPNMATYYDFLGERKDDKNPLIIFSQLKRLEVKMDQYNGLIHYIDAQIKEVQNSFLLSQSQQNHQNISKFNAHKAKQIINELNKLRETATSQKEVVRQIAGQIKASVNLQRYAEKYDKDLMQQIDDLTNIHAHTYMSPEEIQKSVNQLQQIYKNAEQNLTNDKQLLREKANFSQGLIQIPEKLVQLIYLSNKLQAEKESEYIRMKNVQQQDQSQRFSQVLADLKQFVQNSEQQSNDQQILNFLLQLNQSISEVAGDVQNLSALLQSQNQFNDVTTQANYTQQILETLKEFEQKCENIDTIQPFTIQSVKNTISALDRLKLMLQSKVSLQIGWNCVYETINSIEKADTYTQITEIEQGNDLYEVVMKIQNIQAGIDEKYKRDTQRNKETLQQNLQIRQKHKDVLDIVEGGQIKLQVNKMEDFIQDMLQNHFDILQANSNPHEMFEKIIAVQIAFLKKAFLFRKHVNSLIDQHINIIQKEGIKFQLLFNINYVDQIVKLIKDFIMNSNQFITIIQSTNTTIAEMEQTMNIYQLENYFSEELIAEFNPQSNNIIGEQLNQIYQHVYQNEIKMIIASLQQNGSIEQLKIRYDQLIEDLRNKMIILKKRAELYFKTDYLSVDLIMAAMRKSTENDLYVKAMSQLEQAQYLPKTEINQIIQYCNGLLSNEDQYTAMYNVLVYANGQLLKEQVGPSVQIIENNINVYNRLMGSLSNENVSEYLIQFYKDMKDCASEMLTPMPINDGQCFNLPQTDDISTIIDNRIENNQDYQAIYMDVQLKVSKMQKFLEDIKTQIHKQLQNTDIQLDSYREKQTAAHQTIVDMANYCLVNCIEMIRYASTNGKMHECDGIQNIVKQIVHLCQDSKQLENVVSGFVLQKHLQWLTQEYLTMIDSMAVKQIERCQQYAIILQDGSNSEYEQQQTLYLLRLSLLGLQTFKEQLMQFTLLRKQIYGTLSLDNDFSQYNNVHTSELRRVYSAFIKYYLPDQAISKIPMYALLQHTYNDTNMVVQIENYLNNLCQVQANVSADNFIQEPTILITDDIKRDIIAWFKSLNYAMRQVIDTQGDMSMGVLFKSFYTQQSQLSSIIDKYCSKDEEHKELYDLLEVSNKNMMIIKHVHADVLAHQWFNSGLVAQFQEIQSDYNVENTQQQYQKQDLINSLQQLNSEILNEVHQLLIKTLPALSAIQAQGGCRQKLCMNQFIEQQLNILKQTKVNIDQLNNSLSISQETQARLPSTIQFVQPIHNPFILHIYNKSIEMAVSQALRTQCLDLNNTLAQYKNFEYASLNHDIKACKNALFLLLNDAIQLSSFPQLLSNRSNLETSEYGFDKYEWNYYNNSIGSVVIQYKNVQQLIADINKMVNQIVYIQNEHLINREHSSSFEGYLNKDQVIFKHIAKQVRQFCNDVKIPTAKCKQWELLQHLKLQPTLHSLALRGQILLKTMSEIATTLKLNGEHASLPEQFGFFDQKCLYEILGEKQFQPVVLSLKLLSTEAANNIKTEVTQLLSSLNEAIRTLKNEQSGYSTFEELLKCTVSQNQYLAKNIAHQQIQVLLSTSYFTNQYSLYRNLVNTAIEIAGYENDGLVDQFRVELRKYFDNYLSENILSIQDPSFRWDQVLTQHYISETLTTLFEELNKDLSTPSDYKHITIPVVLRGDGSHIGQQLVKQRNFMATYEHMDTIGPLIKKFCMTGCRSFIMDPEVERLSTLGYKLFVGEMERLALQEQNVKLYEIENLESLYTECQATSNTINQKLLEVQKRVTDQHKTNLGKYKQQTVTAKTQLTNFLIVYRYTQILGVLGNYVQHYNNLKYYDQQLNTTFAACDKLLWQARPLQAIIQQELELLDNVVLIVGQHEGVELKQIANKINEFLNILVPICQHLTNIEEEYGTNDFRLVRIIFQVWCALGFPRFSSESIQNVLNIAGEIDFQSQTQDILNNTQNFVKSVCSYIQTESLKFVDCDDQDEQACQIVLGTNDGEVFMQ